ncbi:MAG: hydrogenase maturation nickel metallochaperone HypA [Solirubrobacteraceae bacterium]
MRQTESKASAGPSRGRRPLQELSIAQSLADVAASHAEGRAVRTVEVSVGRLREIDAELLRLAFQLVTGGTALDGAQLQIRRPAGDELLIDALELERPVGAAAPR